MRVLLALSKHKKMILKKDSKKWTIKRISKSVYSVKSEGFDLSENNFEFLQRATIDEIKDMFYALVDAEEVMKINNA